MSNGWDSYIWQIQNKYSIKQQKYTTTNVCEHAAIYGIDGSPWTHSAKWPMLQEYEHPLEQEDGSVQNIHVNEFQSALKVAKGTRNPTAAGIRMGNRKFAMVKYEDEAKLAILSRAGGGGACIGLSNNAIVIGIWDKEALMSNNQNQNSGDCVMNVEKIVNSIKQYGY